MLILFVEQPAAGSKKARHLPSLSPYFEQKTVNESPQEKLARLQSEVKVIIGVKLGRMLITFKDLVELIALQKKDVADTAYPVVLSEQVRELFFASYLSAASHFAKSIAASEVGLHLWRENPRQRCAFASKRSDTVCSGYFLNLISRRLSSQISQIKSKAAAAPTADAVSQLLSRISHTTQAHTSELGVTYELFVRPEHSKTDLATKIVQLEQRLIRLEKRIGTDSLATTGISRLTFLLCVCLSVSCFCFLG